MRYRFAAIVAAVVGLLVASVVLVIKTTGSPKLEIDESELAAARAAHQRRQAERAPAPRIPQRDPERRARAPAPEPEPEPEPRPERAEVERARPTLSAQQPENGNSGRIELDDVREAFDRGRFLDALEAAEDYLEHDPDQAYVRRIAVTSACAVGQIETAQTYYDQMNERDQKTSQARCEKYGVEF